MTPADSGKRGGRALDAAEMLTESTGELSSELEKQAQPRQEFLDCQVPLWGAKGLPHCF